jgi:hypothetical protein
MAQVPIKVLQKPGLDITTTDNSKLTNKQINELSTQTESIRF